MTTLEIGGKGTEMTPEIIWFTGSNGNLFGDYDGSRYCIARLARNAYSIARDGIETARAQSVAEAKLYVRRRVA